MSAGRKYIKQNGQIGITTGSDAEHDTHELVITDADPVGGGGAPSGPATGDLAGSYPAPTIAALAITDAKTAAANKDGTAGTPSMRTLGTGALQAAAGNDSRLSDSRIPTGTAAGDLAGAYPNPTLVAFGPGAISKGSASRSAVVTLDAKGRVSTLTDVAITGILGGFASVKDFGAVGDGVADDTTAIVNTIASIATNGGVVWFPPGTYLNTGFTMPSRTTLEGAGWASCLKAKSTITTDMVTPAANTTNWLKIHKLRFDGNNAAVGATVRAINMDFTGFGSGDKQIVCDDLYINNWTGDGFRVGVDCRAGEFSNFYIINCNGHGIVVSGSDNSFHNVSCGNSGLNGWEIVGNATDSLLNNCRGWQSGQVNSTTSGDGFHFNGVKGVKQSGCAAYDNLRHGVNLDIAFDVSVDCDYDSNHADCLHFDNGSLDCFARGTVWNSARATPTAAVGIIGLPKRCRVEMMVDDTIFSSATNMVSGQPNGCAIELGPVDSVEILAFASSLAVDPYHGYTKRIGALTGNITVGNPARKHEGQRLKLIFTQDGTGGRTISFGANFNVTDFLPNLAANAVSVIEFVCLNTGVFVQTNSAAATKAPIASPTFTGVVGLPLGETAVTEPIGSLVTRHGGEYIGKRSLDKWRYTKQTTRTVVVIGDSLAQGGVGGFDQWPERLARDLGNWNGPRLTAGAGYYGLYRDGGMVSGTTNGATDWLPAGIWTPASSLVTWDLGPYNGAYECSNANATAIRTVADAATTINTSTITSATAAFTAADMYAVVTGTNIPPNTYITSINSGTNITVSQRSAATGTALTLNVHGATLTWRRNLATNSVSRYMPDAATGVSSTTLTSSAGNFNKRDVGSYVAGGTIPAMTTITAAPSTTTATLSAAATGNGVGVKVVVHDGRVVQDMACTNTSPIITSATAVFTSADVDTKVVGLVANLPVGTSILSVQSPTQATLSQNATATASGQALFIQSRDEQRVVTDMATNGTTTITSASAAFTRRDVNRHVTGSGIPNNTTIASVTNSTTAVLSNAVALTNTSGLLVISCATPLTISHLEILWVDGVASHGTNFTYSTDGGTTWVQVAQTTTGGPTLRKTLITITNPTTLIVRANTGPGNSPTTKSQTIQCGINAYQAAPNGAGFQMFVLARDLQTLTQFARGGVGDGMAFLDNGTPAPDSATSVWFPGYRPDLVVVLHCNDQTIFDLNRFNNALNHTVDRVQGYADILFIGPWGMGDGRVTSATTIPFNLAMKTRALSTGASIWTVADGVTNTTTTITSATMGFHQSDVGLPITGTDIPAATIITAVASPSSATISNAATGSHSGCTFTITGSLVDTGCAFLDMYEAWGAQGTVDYTACNADGLMYDTVHQSQVGHNEIAGRVSRILRVFS